MKRKNESHELVKESLTDALIYLMERKGFSEINVSELCSRAGVSRISFYRNYTSLQDILTKHLNNCTDAWWESFSKKADEDIYHDFWPELLEQYKKNERLIKLLYKNNVSYLLKEHIFSCCGPKPEHNAIMAFTCSILAGAIYGLVDEWIRRGMKDIPIGLNMREMVNIINKVQNNKT